MKTLYIVRHAKSSWDLKGIKDHDRPLKKRGIDDAHLMAKVLSRQFCCPKVFISSSANRALHTSIIFAQHFSYPLANLQISKQLYSFSDGYLVKTVKALDDGFDTAIVFSHDHGINSFVNVFGDKPLAKVPTCGVVGVSFKERHWKDIKKGETILIEFPKHHK